MAKKTTKAKPKRGARRTDHLANQAAVARYFGVQPSTVSRWARRWPFGKAGPFSARALEEWRGIQVVSNPKAKRVAGDEQRAADLSPDRSDADDVAVRLGLANLSFKELQAIKLQRQIGILDQKYAEREAVQAEIARVIYITRTALLDLPSVMADALENVGLLAAGKTVKRQAIDEIKRPLVALCNQFADGLEQVVEEDINQ